MVFSPYRCGDWRLGLMVSDGRCKNLDERTSYLRHILLELEN